MRMYKIKFFAVSVLLTVFFSCSEKSKPEYTIIQQDVEESVLTNFFEVLSITTLQENPNFFLEEVSKVEYYSNRIAVLDRFDSQQLLIFEQSTGEFLHNVGFSGEGPGGYTFPYDFYIDEENEEILVLTYGKVLSYNLYTGEYIKSKSMPLPAVRFEKFNNDRWLLSLGGGSNYKLALVDSNYDLIDNFIESKPMHSMLPWQSFVMSRDGIPLYVQNYDNVIYAVNEEGNLYYHKVLDFDQEAPDVDLIESISDPRDVPNLLTNKMLLHRHYLELDKYDFFIYMHDQDYTVYIRNIETEEVMTFDGLKSMNDITFEDYFPSIVGADKDGLFGLTRTYKRDKNDQEINANNDELITLVKFSPKF